MKNQILINRPENANYPKDMILMEKNILASILSHKSGQKFILPIFKAFFPQIKKGDQLFIDSTIKQQLEDNGCLEFDGIVAYTKEGDYYILNVHSPKYRKSCVKSILDLIAYLKFALYPAEKAGNEIVPTFYYLGLMPNIEFTDLPNGKKGHYGIEEKNIKGDYNRSVLHLHLEAMKNRNVPSFGHVSWDTKWASLFQAFGDPCFHIPEEKGNKYFKKFYETVSMASGSEESNEPEESVSKNPDEADYIKFANELFNESGLREFLEELEKYVQAGENPTSNSVQSNTADDDEDDAENGAVRVILGFLDDKDQMRTLFDDRMIVKKKHATRKTNNLN